MSSPAVVLVTEFVYDWHVGTGDFLNYMTNPEKFNPDLHKYDEYSDMLDYMRNEEKSDGAFDAINDNLSKEALEIYRQKEIESIIKGNPKYLSVISFDNAFLEEHGIINTLGILDTRKIKDLARSGIAEMIKTSHKLSAENVEWVGAIHTNTDNVHVHFQLFEKERSRVKEQDCLEVKSFDKLKSKILNKIIGNEKTIEISKMTREILLPAFQKNLCPTAQLIELARKLPENAQYNRPKMRRFHKDINKCVNSIICNSADLKIDFEKYEKMLDKQAENLKLLYGDGKRHLYQNYKKNKMIDWYARAGNALLKYMDESNLRELVLDTPDLFENEFEIDENQNALSEEQTNVFDFYENVPLPEEPPTGDDFNIFSSERNFDDYHEFEIDENQNALSEEKNLDLNDFYSIKWSNDYKKACDIMYDKKATVKQFKQAEKLFLSETKKGNVLAMDKLGSLYSTKSLGKKDEIKSLLYYKKALDGFQKLEKTDGKMKPYIQYRLGKIYSYALGTEQDYSQAYEWFLKSASAGNKFAQYSLGSMYYYGNGVKKDYSQAFEWYEKSFKQKNIYASYALAQMYHHGEFVKKNMEKAQMYYKFAYDGFYQSSNPDENTWYKLGVMCQNGLGTEVNIPLAIELHEKSAELGNEKAQYALGKIYASDGEYKDMAKAIGYFEKSAEQGNQYAEKALEYLKNPKYRTGHSRKISTKFINNKIQVGQSANSLLRRVSQDYNRNLKQLLNEYENEQERTKFKAWQDNNFDLSI